MIIDSSRQFSEPEEIQEVLVLGGGLMGSSAAWHLSNQGKSVLLIEKQGTVYNSGSSKGKARITRSSNIENDELWSYLHNRSVREAELLISYLNGRGLACSMEDIYTTSPVSYIARLTEIDQLLADLKKQDVDFEIASAPDQGKSKFGVNLKKDTLLQREYNTYSGTLNPKKLIEYLHKAVALKGNPIWYNTTVERVKRKDGSYSISVVDPDGKPKTLQVKQIVCAAGPYTGQMLKYVAPYFEKLISPKRVFLTFLKIKNEHFQNLTEKQRQQLKNGFPVIDRSMSVKTEEFFSMIENYDVQGNPIIKVGGHFQRSDIVDINRVWRQELSSEEIDWCIEKTLSYLTFLNLPVKTNQIEIVDGYSCVYSLTKNEIPYVTPIFDESNSKDKNFVVMTGMFGVGAKGALTYGLVAANLMTQQKRGAAIYKKMIDKLGYERLLSEISNT